MDKPTTPNNSNGKYNNYDAEIKAVKKYLLTRTVSATMVAVALDIYRPNLTRYKRELELTGLLVVVNQQPCKQTGRKVQYITTNPEIIKQVKEGGSYGEV